MSRWSLEHRLFRETINDQKYVQILDLSYHENNYIVTTDSACKVPAVIAEISSAEANNTFMEFMTTKMGPLWSLRQNVSVRDGQAFLCGDFTVRTGELRQGGGPNALLRGIVVEISWAGDAENEGTEDNEEMIREFWNSMEIKSANVKASVNLPGKVDRFRVVRQWSEVLRLRS